MTMNDYEQRFQCSLQKLAIPSWYVESSPSSKPSSKHSLFSISPMPLAARPEECSRLPEVIHLRRPQSYRSCRSSLATSPSPSIHSWHPTQMMDGMNFSLQIPSRRRYKYEKGIERVSRSSHWYQPSQLSAKGARKVAALTKHRTTSPIKNHYDTPQFHPDEDRGSTERSSIEETIIRLTNDPDVEKTIANKRNNNVIIIEKNEANPIQINDSSSIAVIDSFPSAESRDQMHTVDSIAMQANKRIPSLEILPLSCGQIEDHDKRRFLPPMNNDSHISNEPLYEDDDDDDDDDDDTNSGVRELSNDEDGLRELDENDLSDTDEFIVFAPQAEHTSDHPTLSNVPRSSLNRLYTFAKTTDHHAETGKSLPGEKVSHPASADKPRQSCNDLLDISSIDAPPTTTIDRGIDSMINASPSQLLIHPSSQGVNEETARIGRLLLNSIPIPSVEPIQMFAPSSLAKLPPLTVFEPDEQYRSTFNTDLVEEYHRIPEEFDEEFIEDIHHDSGYSSNQERLLLPVSLYEPLSECYSGFSGTQSDFLITNISSIHSTTDEAYESEPTTMSSSIATNTTTPHVHPDLEHEFDYPSPPPPVPDRRLKPAYLRTPPSTKLHNSWKGTLDSAAYSCIQKTKVLPLTAIQQWIGSTSNKSPSSSLRTMSSRHYCGSIPTASEISRTSAHSPSLRIESQPKEKSKEKRPNKTLNCLHSTADDDHERRTTCIKSSSSSLHKSKGKKQSTKEFDEATNGLAIRLPASMTNGHDSNSRQTLNRISTPTSARHLNGSAKNRPKVDEFKSIRSPFYETSV